MQYVVDFLLVVLRKKLFVAFDSRMLQLPALFTYEFFVEEYFSTDCAKLRH